MFTNPNFEGSPVLIASHHTITQTMLNSVAPARGADFYGNSGVTQERARTLLPIGKLVIELAKICNFTPMVVDLGDIGYSKKIDENAHMGTVIPFIVPTTLVKEYPLIGNKIQISLSVTRNFNFIYCDVDRELLPTNLALLLLPLRIQCWIPILIGLLVIPIFISPKREFVKQFLVTLGPLVSQMLPNRSSDRSKLFILWTLGCFVLNNLYSSALTSLLISPLGKDVMKSLDDLIKRDFRLVYANAGYFKYVSYMVSHLEAKSEHQTPLAKLVGSLTFKPTLDEMIQSLAFEPKTVLYGPDLLAMQYWAKLSPKNQARNREIRSRKKRRSCHLGKILHSAVLPEDWIFTERSKNGTKLDSQISKVFNLLHANGIHSFWMSLFAQLHGLDRAQDVYKFKSVTEPKEDIPLEPLGLDNGSILIIFILYAISISVSCLAFLVEIIKYHLGNDSIRRVVNL